MASAMLLFLTLSALWAILWLGVRHGLSWWRERWFLQPAHYISDIKRVSYFRQLSESQLERLALNALTAHKFLLLGDPILGRAKVQGYAWRAGKKVVFVVRRERPLTVSDLHEIHRLKNKAKAERVLVVSPFSHAPRESCPGVEI